MAGMTLIEAAKLADNDLTKGVVSIFATGSPVLGKLTFEDAPGGVFAYNIETTLPGIGFRAVNGSWTAGSGILSPYVEKVKILGGECDYDIALMRRFGEARRALDVAGKVRAGARYFDKMFIDGDEASDPLQFDGLNKRCGASGGDRTIYTDGSAGGSAGANLTEGSVQCLIDSIYGGYPDMLIMGRWAHRQMISLFKASTLWGMTDPNYFGYRAQTFAGIEIGIIDRDNLDAVILAADESVTGSSVTGSIYAVKYGPQFLDGIQTAVPAAKDFGEIPSSPVMRFRYDWDCGIKIEHPRCVCRLAGITAISGVN